MPLIRWLFDTSMGAPGPDGRWPLWLAVAFHGANLVSGTALCLFPVVIARLWRYHRDGVTFGQFWRVMGFLPWLGLCRLARVVEAAGPPYHLTVILDALAAAHTVYSLTRLVPAVRHVLLLPSRQELHAARDAAQAALAKLWEQRLDEQETFRRLQAHAARLEYLLKTEGWTAEKAAVLAELRATLSRTPTEPGPTA